jgi:hypothetical protein
MEINDIKYTLAKRATGYSDLLAGTLRTVADSLTGKVEEYAQDASGRAANTSEAISDWKPNYNRIGLWLGLGVALVGGALYAWKIYRDMQADKEADPNAQAAAPEPARKEPAANRLKEKVGSAAKTGLKEVTLAAKPVAASTGSAAAKTRAASRASSAQTPRADKVKAKSQRTAHLSAEAEKTVPGKPKAVSKPKAATAKPAAKTAVPSSTPKAKAPARAVNLAASEAKKPRAT